MHFRSTLAQLKFVNYYVERHKKNSALIPHIYLYCEKVVNLHREKTQKTELLKKSEVSGMERERQKQRTTMIFYPIEYFETCCQK